MAKRTWFNPFGLDNKHGEGGGEYMYPGSTMTPAQMEFAVAMERFLRTHHKRMPTCQDVLEVAKSLGYQKG